MSDIQRSGTDAFARLLTEAREGAGLSRRELAEQTGLSYPYVSQLETGYRGPSPEAMQRLTDALGIPVEAMVAAMAERDTLPNRPRPTKADRTAPLVGTAPTARTTPAVGTEPTARAARAGSGWVTNTAWTPPPDRLSAPPSAPSQPAVSRPAARPAAASGGSVPTVGAFARRSRTHRPANEPDAAVSPVAAADDAHSAVVAHRLAAETAATPPLSSPDDVTSLVVADVLARLDELAPEQRLAALSEIQNQVVRTVVADASAPRTGR